MRVHGGEIIIVSSPARVAIDESRHGAKKYSAAAALFRGYRPPLKFSNFSSITYVKESENVYGPPAEQI